MNDLKLCDAPPPARAGSFGPEQQDLYLGSWFDTFFAACVIVTLDLRLVWANGAARRLLSQGAPFGLVADRLACADKAQTGALKRFVEGLGESAGLWACRTAGDGHMLVRGEGLRPAGAEAAAALVIVPANAAPDAYLWADLHEVFGLTRAEGAIVKRFVAGERADEIAVAHGVAIETVRTHIRRIYNKLGINSREQLFSLVSPYRLR